MPDYPRPQEKNLWIYASLAISFVTALVIYAITSEFPFVAPRWVLVSVGLAVIALARQYRISAEKRETKSFVLSESSSRDEQELAGFLADLAYPCNWSL